ncbi:MAG: hypothetical protein J6R23_01920 [Spirochaetales bacterium]|nr:hypothetical protein [Spirochaetales bacterium]
MHELEERRKELPRTLYPMMARELAFCALLDGDAERAAVMIERSRRVRYYWTNADNDRLAAYFAYHARQDAEGALEICRQLTGGQRPGVSGRYIMDAELAEQLKTLIINSENLE